MNMITPPRAIVGALRANSDPATILASLNTAFAEFKTRHDGRLTDIEATINDLCEHNASSVLSPGFGPGLMTEEIQTQFRAAMRGDVSASMEIGSGPDGGYAVPSQVDGQIMSLLRRTSPLRRLAFGTALGTGSGSWKKIVHATGGGTRWAHELEERQETGTPRLGTVEITPEELYAIPELTNHVLDDSSFNLEAFLQDDVAAEMALGENDAFILGDGIKKPLGLLHKPTSNEADTARAFGTYQHIVTGAAGAFANVQDNLIDLIFSLPAAYRSGGGVAWLMNSLTASTIMKFKDADGRMLWRESMASGEPARLLGYPVEVDEAMPDIGADTTPIGFGNWRRGYAIVDRPGMKLIRDNVTKKGWTKLYFSKRVGGAPMDTNAIKFLKFST